MDSIVLALWALIAAGGYCALVLLTLLFYGCVMALQWARDRQRLTPDLIKFANGVLVIGYLLDFLVNVIGCLFLLFTLPRNTLVTTTCSRIKREWSARLAAAQASGEVLSTPWRVKAAAYICTQWLDPLETHPSGCHCR